MAARDGAEEMARGGRRKDRDGPERRCIATGESGTTARLIRFVVGPSGDVVPDIAGKLPGRGVWLTAERALVERAVKKRLFPRAFRAPVTVPDDLPDVLERLLADRLIGLLGMARKAGQAVTGFEKVRARLAAGGTGALVTAADAAEDGRAKLARIARETPRIEALSASELGLAFGREFAIHAALDAGGIADRALAEAGRLRGFRAALTAADARRMSDAPSEDGRQEGPAGGSGQGD
jgi:predicted RNA-binding protein YlxR (DUF448 family)